MESAASREAHLRHVLALDQGTTSSRSLVVDEEGRIVSSAQREHPQSFPKPGWVEHDPRAIADTQLATAREALAAAGLAARDVAALGIANQRESVVLWDRASGEPLHPAIVWQDRRTTEATERLRVDGHEPEVQRTTGLLLDPYFSATKIAWLLDHVPGARRRAERGELAAGTIDAWLLWRLTEGAVHATDVSNASRTLLLDLRTGAWSDPMLALFRVPRAVLPEVRASSGVLAETAPAALGAAVPIAGVAGDQQAALFGQRCIAPGRAKCTYGTGCFLLAPTGTSPRASGHRLLSTVAWRLGAEPLAYALEGSVFAGGAAIQWLRDGLGLVRTAPEVNALAARVPDSGGVFLVPAFAGLGAPHWDPRARAAILGITRGTTAAHVALATLEGIAFQVAELMEALTPDAGFPIEELRVDGGAAASDLLMQIQADLLGIPVARPAATESTALGAAFLAGRAAGLWPDDAALERLWRLDRVFTPRIGAGERAERIAGWKRAVERVRGDVSGSTGSAP